MEAIKTFVLLDLETSGLPQCSPVKITELSLVAAGKDQILEKHNGVSKENNIGNSYLPRVLNKINLAIYPCKMIHPTASVMSGLTNTNLETQGPFDEGIFNIIQLFLERLDKPICLVAHNGNRFDFPILKSELTKIGKELPEDVFCVDSLLAFRQVLTVQPDYSANQGDVCKDIVLLDAPANTAATLVPKCGWSNDEFDQELIEVTLAAEVVASEYSEFNIEEIDMKIKLEMEKLKKMNESTPVRRPKPIAAPPKHDHVRREILKDARQPKPKFNLGTVYNRVTNKELVDAHRAENDALALLECITAVGLPLLEWMEANKIPFRSIKKMW